jgi:hypothetical protein
MIMTRTCSECNGVTGENKRHKHIWMYSSFCDTCNCDFDKWLQKEKDQVVFDLVTKDFNHMLFEMGTERKIVIDQHAATEVYMRMREVARAKGFLKLPWEKEEEFDSHSKLLENED